MSERTDPQKIEALAAELAKARKKAIKKYGYVTIARWRKEWLDKRHANTFLDNIAE